MCLCVCACVTSNSLTLTLGVSEVCLVRFNAAVVCRRCRCLRSKTKTDVHTKHTHTHKHLGLEHKRNTHTQTHPNNTYSQHNSEISLGFFACVCVFFLCWLDHVEELIWRRRCVTQCARLAGLAWLLLCYAAEVREYIYTHTHTDDQHHIHKHTHTQVNI